MVRTGLFGWFFLSWFLLSFFLVQMQHLMEVKCHKSKKFWTWTQCRGVIPFLNKLVLIFFFYYYYYGEVHSGRRTRGGKVLVSGCHDFLLTPKSDPNSGWRLSRDLLASVVQAQQNDRIFLHQVNFLVAVGTPALPAQANSYQNHFSSFSHVACVTCTSTSSLCCF